MFSTDLRALSVSTGIAHFIMPISASYPLYVVRVTGSYSN